MIGDSQDMLQRLQQGLPIGWFGDNATNVQAIQSGTAWAHANIYSQITYTALQTRIKTATAPFLDIISVDFFGAGVLPRLPNETDGSFRARILGNLFVKGPCRADMNNVLTLVTGRAPTIFEPSNTKDSGGLDSLFYWDSGLGQWGDPLPFQSFVTAYRPANDTIDLGEWDARIFLDAYGAWSEGTPISMTDAAIIAAVESTKALGTVVWLRIADGPITP
jgi:hypothetical protein